MDEKDNNKPVTKRPANTAFKQQRLKAWQPILTPKVVLPAYFIVGLLFIPIGIGLYIASDSVHQLLFDYTYCSRDAPATLSAPPTDNGDYGFQMWMFEQATNTCTIQFDVPETFQPPVFIYYRLTNFYQNHRRYVKSYDASQLSGKVVNASDELQTMCDPIRSARGVNITGSDGITFQVAPEAQYYPCGLIANSLFTDFIGGDPFADESSITCIRNTSAMPDTLPACSTENPISYQFTQNSIAWPADSGKYVRTSWATERPTEVPTKLVPPPEWMRVFPQWRGGYTADNLPDLQKWERFQVWMRTAGMPNFRKLYGRHNQYPLTSGTWELKIVDNFDVVRFSGTKSIVLSSVSFLGGKNPFLGVAYVLVGVLCWILGIIFLVRQMLKPRKLGDHSYLSWNQPTVQNQAGGDQGARNGGYDQRGGGY